METSEEHEVVHEVEAGSLVPSPWDGADDL